MKSPSHPRRQAMLVAALIWGVDAPLLLAPTIMAGKLSVGGLVQAATLTIGGWLFCLAVYEVLQRFAEAPRRKRILGAIAVSLVGGLGLGIVDAFVVFLLGVYHQAPILADASLFLRTLTNTIFISWMLVLFTAIILLLEANRRVAAREAALARAETQTAQAQSAATAARLAALRYQLNPHFLFNTLNTVSSAVMTRRNEEAEVMLARLADFLRATLSADPAAEVRLEEELGTVEAYLQIEAERFRRRLSVVIDCPVALRGALAPSFILQPLVENAIKHGVSRSKARVQLRIAVEAQAEDLVIVVEDDARPLAGALATPGGGIGHTAIRDRLAVLYGARGQLSTEKLDPGFRVTLRLPLKTAAAEMGAA